MKRLLIIFLLMTSVTSAADFNVSWMPIKEDIVNKEYRITIQNLGTDMWTVNVESFFEDTNFDTSKIQDVEFYEQLPKNKMMILDKKQSKTLKTNKKIKEVSHGKITLPSVKTKGKINNKGTKTFILKFKTPPDGNHGKVGLKINGKEYHPYWNSTWSNRKKITLTGTSSGSQTDYQLLLNVTYESEMNPDFSDVRFCNETDQLSAWLESKVNESYALIWVKFPHTPTDGEIENYWMYYGNSEASAYWDGDTTFEFFDDFESGSFSSGWTYVGTAWSVQNGIGVGEHSNNGRFLTKEYIYEKGAIQFLFKSPSSTTRSYPVYPSDDLSNNLYWLIAYEDGHFKYYNSSYHNFNIDTMYTSNTWYKISITWNFDSDKYDVWIDDEKISGNGITISGDGTSFDTMRFLVGDAKNQLGDIHLNNVIFHKYTANPPTATFGTEEYYVDSIYFNSSNPYYNLIDYKGDIDVNHTYSSSDDLEWTAQAVDDDTGLIVTSMSSSEIDFSIYESVLDWLQLVNLDNSKIYTLQNSSGDLEEHQASGNAVNFTTDLSPDDYEIEITGAVTPTPTPEPSPTSEPSLHDIKMSDKNIKEMYYPFMYILFIVIIIGGFMHVFGN